MVGFFIPLYARKALWVKRVWLEKDSRYCRSPSNPGDLYRWLVTTPLGRFPSNKLKPSVWGRGSPGHVTFNSAEMVMTQQRAVGRSWTNLCQLWMEKWLGMWTDLRHYDTANMSKICHALTCKLKTFWKKTQAQNLPMNSNRQKACRCLNNVLSGNRHSSGTLLPLSF